MQNSNRNPDRLYCLNCTHATQKIPPSTPGEKRSASDFAWWCTDPAVILHNPVTGSPSYLLCETLRMYDPAKGYCGPAGQHFSPLTSKPSEPPTSTSNYLELTTFLATLRCHACDGTARITKQGDSYFCPDCEGTGFDDSQKRSLNP